MIPNKPMTKPRSESPPNIGMKTMLRSGSANGALVGKLSASAMARINKVGRFRKAVYLVRQPALQVGATLMFVYPQYLAQQCGLRTHK